MNPSIVLRAAPSGEDFGPSTPGYVLTIDTDGRSVVPRPGGGGGAVISVFGRDAVVVAEFGDYSTDLIANDSDVPGATLTDALNELAGGGSVVSNASNGLAPQITAGSSALISSADGTTPSWAPITALGSFRCVAAAVDRNALPDEQRVIGLTVYQVDTDQIWRLIGGIANGNWVNVTVGPVSNALSGVAPAFGAGLSVLQSDGTTAAWNAFLQLGTNPATTGDIRLGAAGSICFHTFDNASNITAISMSNSSANVLSVGNATLGGATNLTSPSSVRLVVGATQVLSMDTTVGFVNVPTLTFVKGGTAMINNNNFVSTSKGADIVIRAQGTTAATFGGGTARLQGGRAGAGGLAGGAAMQLNPDDAAFQSMVEAQSLANGRVVALALGADVSTTQMPANTGDRVVFVANAATNASAGPVGGFTFASKAGNPAFFTPNATKTTVGAAGAASALPALPTAYIPLTHNGVDYAVPAYTP